MANGATNGNLAKAFIEFTKTVGVPSAFLLLLFSWGAFYVTPPIIEAHTEFLKKSSEAQTHLADGVKELNKTVGDLNISVEKVVDVEEESQVFMKKVAEEHTLQLQRLADHDEDIKEGLKTLTN